MKMFMVDVKHDRITITHEKQLAYIHFGVCVDGSPVLYQVIRSSGLSGKAPADWRERGMKFAVEHSERLRQPVT